MMPKIVEISKREITVNLQRIFNPEVFARELALFMGWKEEG